MLRWDGRWVWLKYGSREKDGWSKRRETHREKIRGEKGRRREGRRLRNLHK
jgi:hypothetical protein